MSRYFLDARRLAKRFPQPGSEPLTVFEDVSFGLDQGEFVCIIGHSGCGKSTILNALAGLDSFSEGTLEVAGKEVAGPSLERGVVFQNYSLLPWLSALENVEFGVRARFRSGRRNSAVRTAASTWKWSAWAAPRRASRRSCPAACASA